MMRESNYPLLDMITLPPGAEQRRDEVEQAALGAIAIVTSFATANGWARHTEEPFFDRIEICPSKAQLWERMLEINECPSMPAPTDAVTAALEKRILLAIFIEEARRARPEYFKTELDWTQTLAHEMIHQLHVRILAGNEDAMGPEWFYEGFAVLGSGQPLDRDIVVRDIDHALELTKASGRGAYARFVAALRFFVNRLPLQRLVDKASDPNFESWLRQAAAGL
jgi:hypothetical protein